MEAVPVIDPNMLRGLKRHLATAGVNFRPISSMGPILSQS